MTTQLQLDCSLSIDSKELLAVPIDKDKYLAVYDGNQLRLYEFDKEDCHLHHSKPLEPNEKNKQLSFLHVYNMENPDTGERTFLLIGISASLKTISTWYLMDGNITFRGTSSMPWDADPNISISASQWATNTVSKLLYRLNMQEKVALVVLLGDQVVFYSVDTEKDQVEWNALYSLDVSQLESPIQSIQCAPNIMAIVSGQESNTLSLWTNMRTNVAPSCTTTLTFDEPIRHLAWNLTSDAQNILAIAFPKRIEIFGQKRAFNTALDQDTWVCYTKFNVDTPEDINALTWVDVGVLIVAAGNQLLSYLKWLTEQDTVEKSIKPHINNKLEPMSSIFDISYEMNGPLPFYHPNHLIHYIMWGKMDLVQSVLVSLYDFLKQFVDDEDNNINEFPLLSFPKMLKLQDEQTKKTNQKQQCIGLFDADEDNDDSVQDDDHVRHLTLNEAKNLIHSLKSKSLPGLNENEKTHLIAMVNTIVEIADQGEALDENGARFIALLENYFHLKQALPENQEQLDLNPKDYVWALHSQSQDLLLERCIRLCGEKFVWQDARSLGMFFWLQKIDVVRNEMTRIARNIYLSKQDYRDPIDCTLFYLALRKKPLLQGLWNSAAHHKEQAAMKKFLANDFNDPRWQRAASKNAFALLGKQRFEYAAAFFLLADKLKDAINVILKNLKDYQLAIAICRVYEGDHSPLLRDILENTVIPAAVEANDRWLTSMAFWLLNKQKEAVRSMVVPLSQFTDKTTDTSEADSAAIVHDPNAFILYHYLKQHVQQTSIVPYDIEYRFSLFVSRSYERLGCPLLALYILTKYYMKPPSTVKKEPAKLERAQDLFEEPETKPSFVTDFFADEPSTKPSYSSDLFADDNDLFAEPKKPSYASNLFDDDDDLFEPKKTTSSGGLFDDEQDSFTENQDDNKTDDSVREQDGLDAYKALLVIRLLQTFFHAASALYNGLEEPDNVHEIAYRSNFLLNRKAILDLGASFKISPDVLSRLLMEKSIETDVFPLYLYILNEQVPNNFDVHQFLRAFKVGCFEVNEVALMPQELDYATLAFVENWTDHVLKTFSIWSNLRARYCNPKSASLMTHQIVLTTYLSMILITLKERYYEKCWTLLCHFKFFLEALGSTDSLKALKSCLAQLTKNDIKMAEMTPDDFESFSEESLFGYDMHEEVYRPLIDSQDKEAGANILEIASLHFVLSSIEHSMQCQGRHNSLSEQLSDFTWTTLLDPVAYRAHCLKQTISRQLENNMTRHHVMKQFKTLRQKKFWRSIKSLSSFDRLLPFINASVTFVCECVGSR
ncbi:RAVE protein 1 C terminal-domain-containing protein [Gilbertella persicaria]|uniref:RAVE protein 1 C terminal-domain-containing protein n=1 Tax=Gilbertella persicaria TaxID=101096 RepID=UPI002220A9D9|nr:RAVE protein 1 C terminal-domain-containing protein [Gilbertella persicaria]KAI8047369.1 RAVE protein 1 C terminal-domain-containing protein [Gilbertella persicaria]